MIAVFSFSWLHLFLTLKTLYIIAQWAHKHWKLTICIPMWHPSMWFQMMSDLPGEGLGRYLIQYNGAKRYLTYIGQALSKDALSELSRGTGVDLWCVTIKFKAIIVMPWYSYHLHLLPICTVRAFLWFDVICRGWNIDGWWDRKLPR